jgi:hypothetical protein
VGLVGRVTCLTLLLLAGQTELGKWHTSPIGCLVRQQPVWAAAYMYVYIWDILGCIDISSLMMRTEMALRTSVFYGHLTWLTAHEDLINLDAAKAINHVSLYIYSRQSNFKLNGQNFIT